MVIQLFYWNLRALGEPVRLMLEHLGAEYESKPMESFEAWFKQKFDIGLDFPNLPHVIDGDVKISQSFACMRYLSRKFKSLGAVDEVGQQQLDVAEGAVNDFRMNLIRTVWFTQGDFDKAKKDYFDGLAARLRPIEDVLGKRRWIAGDNLTYVDFALAECLDHHEMMVPDSLKCSPNVHKYYQAFFALPKIDAYRKSARFQRWPVSGGPSPKWGGAVTKKNS